MGTITPHLNLYKPEGPELVDVEAHLNDNYDKIDAKSSDHESRISNVESVSGLVPWKVFTPVFKRFGGSNLITSGLTVNIGRCFKLGDLVFVDARIAGAAGSISDGTTTVTNPILFAELPYKRKLIDGIAYSGPGALSNIVQFNSGEEIYYVPAAANGTDDYITFQPSGSYITDTTTDIDWDIVTGINFTGWYRSSGVERMTLTDE